MILFSRCGYCRNRLYCCYTMRNHNEKDYKIHYHCAKEFDYNINKLKNKKNIN